jgi:hypothetical protein
MQEYREGMKWSSFIIGLLMLPTVTLAQEEGEWIDESMELAETGRITDAEVKALIQDLGPEKTCLDEYLTRRRQLITSLSLTPVKASVYLAGGVFGGGLLYKAIGSAGSGSGYFNDDLVLVVMGMITGGAIGGGAAVFETLDVIVKLKETNQHLKATAEAYLERKGFHTQKFYARYLKGAPATPVDLADFQSKLREFDQTQKTCDGSLGHTPKIHLFKRLKHRLANPDRLFAAF